MAAARAEAARAASGGGAGAGGGGGGGGKSAGTTARRKAAKGGEGRIVIHVYDEGRNIQRDFSCNLRQLLSSMRYFQVRGVRLCVSVYWSEDTPPWDAHQPGTLWRQNMVCELDGVFALRRACPRPG
jgi:hypothetical protein